MSPSRQYFAPPNFFWRAPTLLSEITIRPRRDNREKSLKICTFAIPTKPSIFLRGGGGRGGRLSVRALNELFHEGRHLLGRRIGRRRLRLRREVGAGRTARRLFTGPQNRRHLEIRGTAHQTTRRSPAPRYARRSHDNLALSTSRTQNAVRAAPLIVCTSFTFHAAHQQLGNRGPPRGAENVQISNWPTNFPRKFKPRPANVWVNARAITARENIFART